MIQISCDVSEYSSWKFETQIQEVRRALWICSFSVYSNHLWIWRNYRGECSYVIVSSPVTGTGAMHFASYFSSWLSDKLSDLVVVSIGNNEWMNYYTIIITPPLILVAYCYSSYFGSDVGWTVRRHIQRERIEKAGWLDCTGCCEIIQGLHCIEKEYVHRP